MAHKEFVTFLCETLQPIPVCNFSTLDFEVWWPFQVFLFGVFCLYGWVFFTKKIIQRDGMYYRDISLKKSDGLTS